MLRCSSQVGEGGVLDAHARVVVLVVEVPRDRPAHGLPVGRQAELGGVPAGVELPGGGDLARRGRCRGVGDRHLAVARLHAGGEDGPRRAERAPAAASAFGPACGAARGVAAAAAAEPAASTTPAADAVGLIPARVPPDAGGAVLGATAAATSRGGPAATSDAS